MTAAQHKRSANKNRYKILYPFEAIISEIIDRITIKIFDDRKEFFRFDLFLLK